MVMPDEIRPPCEFERERSAIIELDAGMARATADWRADHRTQALIHALGILAAEAAASRDPISRQAYADATRIIGRAGIRVAGL